MAACAHIQESSPANPWKESHGRDISTIGEQGWRNGDRARLPSIWPGFNPGPGVISGLSLLLVLILAKGGGSYCFFGSSGFPLSTKFNISKIPIRLGSRGPPVCQTHDCYALPPLNKVNLWSLRCMTGSMSTHVMHARMCLIVLIIHFLFENGNLRGYQNDIV